MDSDDPITRAILSDSVYERLRAGRFGWFKQPLSRKLTVQGYLLHVLAAILPILALLPPEIKQAYFSRSVVGAAPKVAVLALVAVTVIGTAGAGLSAVGAFRLWRGDDFDEHTAQSVLNFEDLCSMLGLATGTIATVATYLFVLVGFGGGKTLQAWIATGGGNPYAPSGYGLNVGTVAVTALCIGVVLQVVSTYLYARGLTEADIHL
ncbi:hypothetical protein [Halobaculum limi]|uniref:hypothetical protein n=1 Tax=Halobaculum limi TaxID=3031916 RepID=UPI002405668A|nr:hypothetical protein [Halobaculum sp. YSMS11]